MASARFLTAARHFLADQNASGVVEFAFLSPLLIMMAFLTIDLGLGGYSQMQVQNAAQAGAEYALYNFNYQGYNSQNTMSAVTSATSNSGISASPAPVQFSGCVNNGTISTVSSGTVCNNGQEAGTYVSVYSTVTYAPLVSYAGISGSYVLKGQATVRVQ